MLELLHGDDDIQKVFHNCKIFKHLYMRIIGIDPGLSGGIAVLDDLKIYDIFDMPIMSEGEKIKIN